MATKAAVKEKETLPAPTKASGPPTAFLDEMEKYADAGLSKDAADNMVPLVYILQPLSPQVEKSDDKYIEGAEASDIWLRSANSPIVKGSEGILFQPCYFSVDWVEWIPRDSGGGFVGRHKEVPEDAGKMTDPQTGRTRFLRPNGNEVIETRNHVGFVITEEGVMPYVIPMSSTGHTVSREWMFKMNGLRLPSGKSAPMWAGLWRMKTRMRKNKTGRWFTWDVNQEGWVANLDEFNRGKDLHQAFASGEKEIEAPQQPDHPSGAADDDSKPM